MRAFIAVLSGWLLSGCAISYQDDQGYTHYVGFADIRVRRPADDQIAAEAVRWRTLGLGVRLGDPQPSLVLGYSEEAVVYLGRDAIATEEVLERLDR